MDGGSDCWRVEENRPRCHDRRTLIRLSIFTGTPEADNRILEFALAERADLIVSGDGDLLRLGAFQNIPIVRPVHALRILDPEPR